MGDDMANAELGIAKTDAHAVKNRLSQTDGLRAQQQWNSHYLGERTLGFQILLCVSSVIAVWTIEVAPLVRYVVTGIVVALAAFWYSTSRQKSEDLEALRAQQVRDHEGKSSR